MRKFLITAIAAALFATGTAQAAGDGVELPDHDWSFTGIFGSFDRPQLKRGFQVYAEVCATCHGLSLVAYRNLADIGMTGTEISEYASQYEIEDGPDDEGEMYFRPAVAADRFVPPFANEQAARAANGGAYPPDLSLIVKARKDGANYLYGLLIGYEDEAPEGVEIGEDMYYNAYFPGHQIAMPTPLYEDSVEYADGTAATVEQLAEDVTVFLAWTASPELEARKRLGLKVLLFLLVLTGMLYALKRQVWSKLH